MIASELTFLREGGRKGKEEKNNNLFRWREIEGKKKKKKRREWIFMTYHLFFPSKLGGKVKMDLYGLTYLLYFLPYKQNTMKEN